MRKTFHLELCPVSTFNAYCLNVVTFISHAVESAGVATNLTVFLKRFLTVSKFLGSFPEMVSSERGFGRSGFKKIFYF
jgi:hypothetical protein